MLRNKLFKVFALLVALLGVMSSFLGITRIQKNVVQEAQKKVALDLSAARAVFEGRLREVEVVLRMASTRPLLLDAARESKWDNPELQAQLERVRVTFAFDFISVVNAEGKVTLRATPPFRKGDYRVADPVVAAALKGSASASVEVLSSAELQAEGDGLTERAFLQIEDTPRARRTDKKSENRGMVMLGAAPLQAGNQVIGAIYGGVLVNRNFGLIDRIHDVVYRNEQYKGMPLGTATIFLGDCRVTTTVRTASGNRAIGTRVSKEVADRVLDNGRPWIGEAFVVRDWYLTAYEPVRNAGNEVIGMLYAGILKRPFRDSFRSLVAEYVILSAAALVAALGLAFLFSSRLAAPIHKLVLASKSMSNGQRIQLPPERGACDEIARLIGAFNDMTEALAEREARLTQLNRSYMETLGFVSHELKSPLSSMMNYVYLLQKQKLGPTTEKQDKAIATIDHNIRRLVEMVRHYLNLSRIESGQLSPVRTRIAIAPEVVSPLLASVAADIAAKGMRTETDITDAIHVEADINMCREIFENLLSNAIKYGREGGLISLRARPGPQFVGFTVRNDGEGIAPEKMAMLFQKFSRLDGSRAAREEKGTGLGLFITKSLVEAHGGAISVDSQAGQWVEFTFTLPAVAGAPAEPGRRA